MRLQIRAALRVSPMVAAPSHDQAAMLKRMLCGPHAACLSLRKANAVLPKIIFSHGRHAAVDRRQR
jgi:hypothetical protein